LTEVRSVRAYISKRCGDQARGGLSKEGLSLYILVGIGRRDRDI